jgi:hypothetical protein
MQPTDQTSIAEAYQKKPAHKPQTESVQAPRKKKKAPPSPTHVVGKAEHDLGRAVPPRRDVLGHEPLLLRLVEPAREPEIADLQLAVRVHEQIARLEVAMEDISRMDILQAAERLIDE